MADPSKADSSGRVAAVEEGGKTWWDTVILVSGIVGALFFIPVSVLTQYSKSWAVLELTLISLFLFVSPTPVYSLVAAVVTDLRCLTTTCGLSWTY